jgi:hypothetical protein
MKSTEILATAIAQAKQELESLRDVQAEIERLQDIVNLEGDQPSQPSSTQTQRKRPPMAAETKALISAKQKAAWAARKAKKAA